ncbi:MAG: M3 family metallopeptidase, partial [Candidatus Thorarchaeota archaeon]
KNWSEVKSSVIKAYRSFDDEIGDFVSELFDNHQVDYVDRPGRVNLKFCYPSFKKKTAFVFFTYTGIMNDAYVAAHEIGHAVYSYFTDTNQRLLNRDYSSCIAETGSIFGELLLTEQLVKDCDTNELRIEILAKVLDRFYQLAFHTGIWALFERDVYEFIESGGYLDADKACEIWRENRHKLYGDNVDWVKNSEYEWPTWGQLFRPNFRFYNYTYCFAQMVVYALYNDFKRGESDFNERFKTLLSRGGSMSPREQLAELGYDITRPGFWQLGIKQADTFLDDLRRLI